MIHSALALPWMLQDLVKLIGGFSYQNNNLFMAIGLNRIEFCCFLSIIDEQSEFLYDKNSH
jgi:hypothetical protein